MRVKTSITLPENLLASIDQHTASFDNNRSAFIEAAVRALITQMERGIRDPRDMEIINREADLFESRGRRGLVVSGDSLKRGELYRVANPSSRDPKRSRVFVVVSRQVVLDSQFSTVVCAPVYTQRDGLASQSQLELKRA